MSGSGIHDFGEAVSSPVRPSSIKCHCCSGNTGCPAAAEADDTSGVLVQWCRSRPAPSRAVPRPSANCQPASTAAASTDWAIRSSSSSSLAVDDLLDFPGSLPHQIVQEIGEFWTLAPFFRTHGYLHRRGYLLYGPPGSGKSAIIAQVAQQMIAAGNLVVFCHHPSMFSNCMTLLRRIEPARPVLCVFEDIDALIEEHGESEILQWLDGGSQIDTVVSMATTNFPERLDRRIVARPRRFDRLVKVEHPDQAVRTRYLAHKFRSEPSFDAERWGQETEGLSFAALTELSILVLCLRRPMEEAVALVRSLSEASPTSREFAASPMGFNHRRTDGGIRNGE